MIYYLDIITCYPSVHTTDHPKLIVFRQQEESINIQSINILTGDIHEISSVSFSANNSDKSLYLFLILDDILVIKI